MLALFARVFNSDETCITVLTDVLCVKTNGIIAPAHCCNNSYV